MFLSHQFDAYELDNERSEEELKNLIHLMLFDYIDRQTDN